MALMSDVPRRSAGSSGSREAARPPPSRPSTFLQLKTPARWHAGGARRGGGAAPRGPALPTATLDLRTASSDLSW